MTPLTAEQERLRRIWTRALVEAEQFLTSSQPDYVLVPGVGFVHMADMAPLVIHAVTVHHHQLGIDIDRTLATGEWAPRPLYTL